MILSCNSVLYYDVPPLTAGTLVRVRKTTLYEKNTYIVIIEKDDHPSSTSSPIYTVLVNGKIESHSHAWLTSAFKEIV